MYIIFKIALNVLVRDLRPTLYNIQEVKSEKIYSELQIFLHQMRKLKTLIYVNLVTQRNNEYHRSIPTN